MSEELYHYGTKRKSGRYEWGSGEIPYQHEPWFTWGYDDIKKLYAEGYSQKEVAEKTGVSIAEQRQIITVESNARRAANIRQAQQYREHGYSYAAIAEKMGVPDRTVRNWLQSDELEKATKISNTAEDLKSLVDEKGYIDVGSGTEYTLGVTKSKLDGALRQLTEEGYTVHTIKVKNVTDPSKFTNVKVLCPPETTWGYIQNHQELVQPITDFSPNGGIDFQKVNYPSSINSDRVYIRYDEQGGSQMDGVIQIRRGVKDLSLGNANYAQVRIAVDDTHYLKGMAMYSDDIPKGYDVIFNTNKAEGTPKEKVFKALKDDKDLPFGAVVPAKGQSYYEDANGKYIRKEGVFELTNKKPKEGEQRYSLSAVNKLKEEGEWNEYSRTLSSQMLSKQNVALIKQQLKMTYEDKANEFKDICAVTNPEIKKKLLMSFASGCDAAASDLKAVALPGQTTKVILPLTCMKDDQIYAPSYPNGTQVCLIRYPHAGTFEIPTLTVNNNNKKARNIMGTSPIDAVGINSSVAERLSGADFDGDTVVVIPLIGKTKINTSKPLEKLKGFDPKKAYPKYEGMAVMTSKEKGMQMGMVSNLITDMTLRGASPDELARAVRHSMVVIDAEKHELNWKQSEIDNGIAALQRTYQKKGGGASTLISKASGSKMVDERKDFRVTDIDRKTGELSYRPTGRTYLQTSVRETAIDGSGNIVYDEKGKVKKSTKTYAVYKDKDADSYYYTKRDSSGNKTKHYVDASKVRSVTAKQESTKMAEVKNAYDLSSGTKVENEYAKYANQMKELANESRRIMVNTPSKEINRSAKETYASEVASLNAKLSVASQNAPKERQAQIIASTQVKKKIAQNPNMSKESVDKIKQQALAAARVQTGASRKNTVVHVTDREWEAIESGALSSTTLSKILNHMDLDEIKERATPRDNLELSSAKVSMIKGRIAAGFTIAEVAESLNISPATVSKYIKE